MTSGMETHLGVRFYQFCQTKEELMDVLVPYLISWKLMTDPDCLSADKLDFPIYLQKLVENFFQTYRLGNIDVGLKMDPEENVFFDMDTAVPLGMIVNELISNSFKYEFPGRETGEIQIKLFSEGDKDKASNKDVTGKSAKYTLVISDNGIGIPENIDIETRKPLVCNL